MKTRREFLKRAALLGTAVALPVHHLFAESPVLPESEGGEQFGMSYAEVIRPKRPSARKIAIPNVGEYKVIKGDFHIHTIYSDGQVKPEARVQEAADNGLDVIAITDHVESSGSRGLPRDVDRNMAYNLAKSEAERRKILLVQGTEISQTTVPGHLSRHFNALFITDANPIFAVTGDWKAMLDAAAEQKAFIHWNHPGHRPGPDAPDKRLAFPFVDELEEARAKGHIHGIEVFNGVWHYPFAHDWCNKRDLAPFANSDIHSSEWNTYGHQNVTRPITLVLAKEQTLESVREAFFAKRTVGWAANMILGRDPWVEKLFTACIETSASGRSVTIKNKSDIPMNLQVRENKYELKPQGEVAVSYADGDTLSVTNWFVGAFKPLELTFASLVS